MDYSRLRGKIKEVCKTELNFSKAIGLNRSTLSMKLNNKSQWTIPEMEKACSVLGISLKDISDYFFSQRV